MNPKLCQEAKRVSRYFIWAVLYNTAQALEKAADELYAAAENFQDAELSNGPEKEPSKKEVVDESEIPKGAGEETEVVGDEKLSNPEKEPEHVTIIGSENVGGKGKPITV